MKEKRAKAQRARHSERKRQRSQQAKQFLPRSGGQEGRRPTRPESRQTPGEPKPANPGPKQTGQKRKPEQKIQTARTNRPEQETTLPHQVKNA